MHRSPALRGVRAQDGRECVQSEREHGRVLSCPEHVHERLTHEKSNGDTDRNRYHSTPDVYPVARCGDRPTSSLRETRLKRKKKKKKRTAKARENKERKETKKK